MGKTFEKSRAFRFHSILNYTGDEPIVLTNVKHFTGS